MPLEDDISYETELTNSLEENKEMVNENEEIGDSEEQEEREVNKERLETSDVAAEQRNPRRPTRETKKPAWLGDFVTPGSSKAMSASAVTTQIVSPEFSCFLAAIEPRVDPVYFHQAVKSPCWMSSMNEDLDALERNNTWEVTTLPPNRKAIGIGRLKCVPEWRPGGNYLYDLATRIQWAWKQDKYELVITQECKTSMQVGNDMAAISDLKKELSSHFTMKDMGAVNYFLGLEIDRSEVGFFMSQKKYVMDMLKDFGMLSASPLKVPMDTHITLTPDKGELLQDPHPYQRLLGKLIYLTITRPDLAFSVHNLAQYMQKPTNIHMQAAKRVLRYLLGTPEQGILLASTSVAQLIAYCDSDWASCPTTKKSTSGYCVLLGISPVLWKTKKQSVVARSTAEAEYRAMALTCCEVTWLSSLLKDMGLLDLPPTLIKSDNQAALSIAANPVLHERTKHIEIDCHFIIDKIVEGVVTTAHVPSHLQLADVLIKQLPIKQQNYLLRKLSVSAGASTPLEGE
ncbi:hypothetical protein AgCh_003364 [Apium graveolens]